MRTLATLQSPEAGTITFNGDDAIAAPDRIRAQLDYLPQQIGAYPTASSRSRCPASVSATLRDVRVSKVTPRRVELANGLAFSADGETPRSLAAAA